MNKRWRLALKWYENQYVLYRQFVSVYYTLGYPKRLRHIPKLLYTMKSKSFRYLPEGITLRNRPDSSRLPNEPRLYSTLPALAGMVVSMELVAASAEAIFLPAKLVKKLVVV